MFSFHRVGLFFLALFFAVAVIPASSLAQADRQRLSALDLFDLQYVSEPQIAPDGQHIVYVRNINDIVSDRTRSNLWIVRSDGSEHRPLHSGRASASSPRWSPDGSRLAYLSDTDGMTQLFVRWIDSGQTALISNLTESPSAISWSPDGRTLAFVMRVPADKPALAEAPESPENAEWAPEVRVIDSVVYRFDGRGYIEPGFDHVFVVPAEGGSARQLTRGDFDHHGPLAWTPDGREIVLSANRDSDWQYERSQRDLFAIDVASGQLRQLTDLPGEASSPTVAPDGDRVAFEYDNHQGRQYSESSLAIIGLDGEGLMRLGEDLDRSMSDPVWAADSSSLYFRFDDRGQRKVGRVGLDGALETLVSGLSGTTIGRPYLSGSFSVADDGTVAYTAGSAQRPADLHVTTVDGSRRLTDLNRNLLDHRDTAEVHEIRYRSSVDDTEIQGWYLTPPGFDPEQRYPLILEIHGGPHLAYGPHFSAEMQRFAAEGFVVFYDNHRGSSSYGEEFGLKLEYKYSSEDDFGDHMSGIDAMIELGFVDPERLFITGGSAGGIAAA